MRAKIQYKNTTLHKSREISSLSVGTKEKWQLAQNKSHPLYTLHFMGDWILAIGYWIWAIGDWILAIGDWILAIGDWILVIGYWIWEIGYW